MIRFAIIERCRKRVSCRKQEKVFAKVFLKAEKNCEDCDFIG